METRAALVSHYLEQAALGFNSWRWAQAGLEPVDSGKQGLLGMNVGVGLAFADASTSCRIKRAMPLRFFLAVLVFLFGIGTLDRNVLHDDRDHELPEADPQCTNGSTYDQPRFYVHPSPFSFHTAC